MFLINWRVWDGGEATNGYGWGRYNIKSTFVFSNRWEGMEWKRSGMSRVVVEQAGMG